MLQEKFDRTLRQLAGNTIRRRKILLAVSGGIDSMCMANLYLHSSMKLDFALAHVNFSLREHDCDLDQKLVEDWASRNGVKCHTVKYDTHTYAKERSISTQMAARELRYNWFYSLMDEYGYDYLSIAHNQNDSVETLFLNLLRGTGVKGLMGIKQVNGKIIRPLLDFTRKEISEYMSSHKYEYRDDMTNFESHYSRNRIRNIVFPEFRKINPSFMSSVYRSTYYFSQASDVLDDLFESKKGTLYYDENNQLIIDIENLKKERQMNYWLYRLVSMRGFNSSQANQIAEALDSTGKTFRSATDELVIDRGKVRIYPVENLEKDEILEIYGPGVYTFRGVTFKFELSLVTPGFSPKCEDGQLFFDAEKLVMPLICRAWKNADKFRPFGMSKGFKKISDFYTDMKISKPDKEKIPLIFNGKDLVCIPGMRIDDRYKIRKATKIVAEIVIV